MLNKSDTNHLTYRADIDGLRAVAVIPVVIHHAFSSLMPGGFIGVDIFFVISGYLITKVLIQDSENGGISIIKFYRRRILRIFPALIAVLFSCLLAGWLLLRADQYEELGKHIAFATVFIANHAFWNDINYFQWDAKYILTLNIWSLSVEEQFYVLWPFFMMFFLNKKYFWIIIFFVFILSFSINIGSIESDPSRSFYWVIPRAWELMVGAALALSPTPNLSRASSKHHLISILGAILLCAGFALIHPKHAFPGYWALLPTSGAALLIAAGPHAIINRRILSHPIAVFIGLISYPLYLWHWPLLAFGWVTDLSDSRIARVAIVIVSMVLAWLTFRWIEIPVRRRNAASPTLLVLTMVAIGAIGWGIFTTNGVPSRAYASRPQIVFLQHYADLHKSLHVHYRSECDFYDHVLKNTRKELDPVCLPQRNTEQWMIWGDSHAQALYPGLRKIVPIGTSIAQVTTSGCAPSLLPVAGGYRSPCEVSNLFARKRIESNPPDVLILAQAVHHELNDWEKIASFARTAGVKKIVVVGPVPQWRPSLPAVVAQYYWGSETSVITNGFEKHVFITDQAMKNRFAISKDISYVSVIDFLCENKSCRGRLSTPPPYNLLVVDYGHLSPMASEFIATGLLSKALSFP